MPKKGVRKKSTTSGGVERIARKEPYTSARMTLVVDRLRDQAARLSALARGLEDSQVGQIVVDGHAMLIRGMNQIDNFADNASRAIREARSAKETI
jgi:hypothetical protein